MKAKLLKQGTSPFMLFLFLVAAHFPARIIAQSVNTPERVVTKIAENTYVIQHKDFAGMYVEGNTTVIIGDSAVLVVDAPLPSLCREDIADIKKWTTKPVKYLLNTHWHPDHERGNPAYAEAFPGITIIAQEETARLMKAFDTENLVRFYKKYHGLEEQVASGKDDKGMPLSDSARKELKKTFDAQTMLMAEYKNYSLRFPDMLFDSQLSIDLGHRRVIIKALKGHTSGDAIAWLPEEKILVAGDQVAWPVPYFFAGNPYEALAGLQELVTLNAAILVPGHGKVLYDNSYPQLVIQLLTDASNQVTSEVYKRGSISTKLEDIKDHIELSAYRKKFAGEDPDNLEFFNASMEGLVKDLFNYMEK